MYIICVTYIHKIQILWRILGVIMLSSCSLHYWRTVLGYCGGCYLLRNKEFYSHIWRGYSSGFFGLQMAESSSKCLKLKGLCNYKTQGSLWSSPIQRHKPGHPNLALVIFVVLFPLLLSSNTVFFHAPLPSV